MNTYRILLERAGQKWDTGITVDAASLIQAAKAMDQPEIKAQLQATLESFLTLEKVPEGTLPGLTMGDNGQGQPLGVPVSLESAAPVPEKPQFRNKCECWKLDGGYPPKDAGAQRSAGRGFAEGNQGGQPHEKGSAGCHVKS